MLCIGYVPTKRAENLPVSSGGAQAPIMGNMAAGKPEDYNTSLSNKKKQNNF